MAAIAPTEAREIGERLAGRRRVVAVLTAITTVVLDFALVAQGARLPVRALLIVPSLAVIAWAMRWHLPSLGLRLVPLQPMRYWLVAALAIGMAILAVCIPYFWIRRDALAWLVELGRAHLSVGWRGWQSALLFTCVEAPLVEEGLYRLILCAPLVAAFGTAPTVALSGLVFGALHFTYGNPAPDNLAAGFVLAWAYLRSGTIVVPIALHAAGNLSVFMLQLLLAILLPPEG